MILVIIALAGATTATPPSQDDREIMNGFINLATIAAPSWLDADPKIIKNLFAFQNCVAVKQSYEAPLFPYLRKSDRKIRDSLDACKLSYDSAASEMILLVTSNYIEKINAQVSVYDKNKISNKIVPNFLYYQARSIVIDRGLYAKYAFQIPIYRSDEYINIMFRCFSDKTKLIFEQKRSKDINSTKDVERLIFSQCEPEIKASISEALFQKPGATPINDLEMDSKAQNFRNQISGLWFKIARDKRFPELAAEFLKQGEDSAPNN